MRDTGDGLHVCRVSRAQGSLEDLMARSVSVSAGVEFGLGVGVCGASSGAFGFGSGFGVANGDDVVANLLIPQLVVGLPPDSEHAVTSLMGVQTVRVYLPSARGFGSPTHFQTSEVPRLHDWPVEVAPGFKLHQTQRVSMGVKVCPVGGSGTVLELSHAGGPDEIYPVLLCILHAATRGGYTHISYPLGDGGCLVSIRAPSFTTDSDSPVDSEQRAFDPQRAWEVATAEHLVRVCGVPSVGTIGVVTADGQARRVTTNDIGMQTAVAAHRGVHLEGALRDMLEVLQCRLQTYEGSSLRIRALGTRCIRLWADMGTLRVRTVLPEDSVRSYACETLHIIPERVGVCSDSYQCTTRDQVSNIVMALAHASLLQEGAVHIDFEPGMAQLAVETTEPIGSVASVLTPALHASPFLFQAVCEGLPPCCPASAERIVDVAEDVAFPGHPPREYSLTTKGTLRRISRRTCV